MSNSPSSIWLTRSPSVVTVDKLFMEDYVIMLIHFQSCLTRCSYYVGTGPGKCWGWGRGFVMCSEKTSVRCQCCLSFFSKHLFKQCFSGKTLACLNDSWFPVLHRLEILTTVYNCTACQCSSVLWEEHFLLSHHCQEPDQHSSAESWKKTSTLKRFTWCICYMM